MQDLGLVDAIRVTSAEVVLRPALPAEVEALAARVPDDYELDPTVPAAGRGRGEVLTATVVRDRGDWRPDAWKLHLIATTPDGRDVGMQIVEAESFARDRIVDSASWLVPEVRGRGLGRAMRAAALAFAFEGLGAAAAVTSAWHDNGPSLGVSAALGYRRTGIERMTRGDGDDDLVHLVLTRTSWAAGPRPPVRLQGVEAALAAFGA